MRYARARTIAIILVSSTEGATADRRVRHFYERDRSELCAWFWPEAYCVS